MTKTEKSWILYDVGNSAFVTIAITTMMPIFFKDVASHGMDPAVSTANWGFANSLASLMLAVLAPIMGTFADYKDTKKRFFSVFLFLGIGFTLLLTTVGQGDWLWCLVIFVMARIGFAGANVFYDSFLVDVTQPNRMDWVSSCGYAWGYIGSVIPFVLSMGLIMWDMGQTGSTVIPLFSARATFIIVAVWWGLLSIPMLKHVRQQHYLPSSSKPIRESFSRLVTTFKEIRKYRRAFLFLGAYFFYIDGVDTIITMSTAYGRDIGLSVNMLILAMLMVQIVAFPFALIYGKLAQRFSAQTMLFIGIGIFMGLTLVSYFLPDISNQDIKTIMFWILGFLVATSLGGIQALSRSIFASLIPSERSAEFFGFYNVFGKFASILGPLLIAMASRITGHSRYGVLSVMILFVIGTVLLIKANSRQ